jgi:hypothetical protein
MDKYLNFLNCFINCMISIFIVEFIKQKITQAKEFLHDKNNETH